MLRSAILALGPGSRSARARALAALGTRERRACEVAAREANRWPLSVFTMSNSAVLFVPAARCCARVCASLSQVPSLLRPPASPRGFGASGRRDSSNSVPPMRGGWSADRRTLSFGRACDARPPCPGATGTSLGAPPWRFSDADPRSRLPAVEPEPQRLPAPSHQCLAVGVRTSRALRFAPQPQDATPRSAFQDRLRKTPLHERGWESLYYKFVT